MINGGATIQSEREARETRTEAEIWLLKIEGALEDEKAWREEAEEAVSIYEGKAETFNTAAGRGSTDSVAFNILHSNTSILVPALYNSTPIPDVRRRYGDPDEIAKYAVELSERLLNYVLDQYNHDRQVKRAVRDSVTAGRGVLRVRYSANVDGDQVLDQRIWCERVHWSKFIRGPGADWDQIEWIAFAHDLTQDQMDAFGNVESEAEAHEDLDKDGQGDDAAVDDTGILETARVYEIWCKQTKSVYWIAADDKEQFLFAQPDPLGLDAFFPIAMPIHGAERTRDLTPVVPYQTYRHQAERLNRITRRIDKLVRSARAMGIVAGGFADLNERMSRLQDGQIAIASDAEFANANGQLPIAWYPTQQIAATIKLLREEAEQIKQEIYEITGLSDILRGASEASETATAQSIKARQASIRIQDQQAQIAEANRGIMRMFVDLACKHFTPQTISQITALPERKQDPRAMMEEQAKFQAAVQLLKSQQRGFKIDIETDSTIRADQAHAQQQMAQFLQVSAQFIPPMIQTLSMQPQIAALVAPAISEVYAAAARHFSLGKQADAALDGFNAKLQQMVAKMEQMAAQPQQQQMDPRLEMEMEKTKLELEQAREMHQLDREAKMMDLDIKQTEAMGRMQERQQQALMRGYTNGTQ